MIDCSIRVVTVLLGYLDLLIATSWGPIFGIWRPPKSWGPRRLPTLLTPKAGPEYIIAGCSKGFQNYHSSWSKTLHHFVVWPSQNTVAIFILIITRKQANRNEYNSIRACLHTNFFSYHTTVYANAFTDKAKYFLYIVYTFLGNSKLNACTLGAMYTDQSTCKTYMHSSLISAENCLYSINEWSQMTGLLISDNGLKSFTKSLEICLFVCFTVQTSIRV